MGPHRGSNLYNEARTQIISAIQIKCDKVSLMNSEKITKLLSSGKHAYQEAYSSVMHLGILGASKGDDGAQDGTEGSEDKDKKHDEVPISPKRLLDIHKAGIKAGQEAFEKDVKSAGLPWVGPGDDRYDFHLYTCLQWSKKQFENLRVCARNSVVWMRLMLCSNARTNSLCYPCVYDGRIGPPQCCDCETDSDVLVIYSYRMRMRRLFWHMWRCGQPIWHYNTKKQ